MRQQDLYVTAASSADPFWWLYHVPPQAGLISSRPHGSVLAGSSEGLADEVEGFLASRVGTNERIGHLQSTRRYLVFDIMAIATCFVMHDSPASIAVESVIDDHFHLQERSMTFCGSRPRCH
jgi:hypothetical protein